MPIVLSCERCGARLRAGEDKIGKTVRCPKCSHTFRVESPEPKKADYSVIGEILESPPPSVSTAPTVTLAPSADEEPESKPSKPAKKRVKKFRKKSQANVGVFVTVAGILGAVVIGLGVIYVALTSFGFFSPAANFFAEITDAYEKSAKAFEDAADPSRRSAGIQQLNEQASRFRQIYQKYKDSKDLEISIEGAERRYKARLEAADQRIVAALTRLEADPTARNDFQLHRAISNWANAVVGSFDQPVAKSFHPSRFSSPHTPRRFP